MGIIGRACRVFAVAIVTLIAGCPAAGAGNGAPAVPETSFVYAQEVRPGVHHIMAFDLDTQATTLVSSLDDNGSSGTKLESLAISPDRAWIAFTAYFRVDPADLTGASGAPTEAIWQVSADGKLFRRVSAPLPALPSRACTVDLECQPEGEICDRTYKHCALRAATRTLDVESFTPDGAALVLRFSQTGIAANGTIVGGSSVFTVNTAGGVPTGAVDVNGACPVAIPGDVHDGQLLVMRGVGIGAGCDRDGVYRVPFPPAGTGQPVVLGDPGIAVNFDVAPVAPRWLEDGSGLLFAGSDPSVRHGLYQTTPDGTHVVRVADLGARLIDTIAVGDSLDMAIVEAFTAATLARDLYRVDLITGMAQPLTTDGKSSLPAL
jgi:hypothetical protein